MKHEKDFHTAFASKVFGVRQEAVSSFQRGVAKLYTFGALYSMGNLLGEVCHEFDYRAAEMSLLNSVGNCIERTIMYQIVLPGFTKCFYRRVLTHLGCCRWGVALDLTERGERLYALYHRG